MSVFDLHVNNASLRHPFNWEVLVGQNQHDSLPVRLYRTLSQRLDAWKYRRALVRLLDFNDHMLEDMGVTRGELIMAIELPLSADARKALAQWRAEREITG